MLKIVFKTKVVKILLCTHDTSLTPTSDNNSATTSWELNSSQNCNLSLQLRTTPTPNSKIDCSHFNHKMVFSNKGYRRGRNHRQLVGTISMDRKLARIGLLIELIKCCPGKRVQSIIPLPIAEGNRAIIHPSISHCRLPSTEEEEASPSKIQDTIVPSKTSGCQNKCISTALVDPTTSQEPTPNHPLSIESRSASGRMWMKFRTETEYNLHQLPSNCNKANFLSNSELPALQSGSSSQHSLNR